MPLFGVLRLIEYQKPIYTHLNRMVGQVYLVSHIIIGLQIQRAFAGFAGMKVTIEMYREVHRLGLQFKKKKMLYSSLPMFLFASSRFFKNTSIQNRIILKCLRIWQQNIKSCELPDTAIHILICYNHAFPPSLSDKILENWKFRGINSLEDMF